MQNVTIKRTDTCLTYVLKRIGQYQNYIDIDGYEFVKMHDLILIQNICDVNYGDIIVMQKNNPKISYKGTSIDEFGNITESESHDYYHFLVHEGEKLTDYGLFGIRSISVDTYKLKLENYTYYKIIF